MRLAFSGSGVAIALFALSASPCAAKFDYTHANPASGTSAARTMPAAALPDAEYNLASGGQPHLKQIPAPPDRTRNFEAVSPRSLEAGGEAFGDGQMNTVEGPVWSYKTSKRGPVFEAAALGGGMENAPFLAHLGVDWQF